VLITNWEQSVDPDGDALTYTLSVAGDADFTDMVYQAEELIESMAVITADAGLEDKKTYYWKATAIDKYGARTESQAFFFTTDNINASPSVATIRMPTDAFTHGAPPSISVTPQRDDISIYSEGGTHNVLLPQQEKLYKILAEAPGHKSAKVFVDARYGTAMEVNVALPPLAVQPVLSVAKYGEGVVSSIPPGIDCGSDCTEEYADTATQVTLTAAPAPHHQFAGWSGGGCMGPETVCNLMMSESRAANAVFERKQYLLAVRKPDDGAESVGYITGTGIDCGADCEKLYPAETEVSLTAQPADSAKYRFSTWVFESSQEQHCMDGDTELLCRFNLLQDETVRADFELLNPLPPAGMLLKLSASPQQLAPGENVYLFAELETGDQKIDTAEIELRFPRTLLAYTNIGDGSVAFQELFLPAENTGCTPEQGCFNLRLHSPSPISGVFTVPFNFTAQENEGTAEICFTANNRFLLKGNEVSYKTSAQGCVSMNIICPALAAAAIDAEQKDMNTQAAFNACMTVSGDDLSPQAAGAQTFTSAEIAFHQEVQISGTISADPAHAEQTADILVVEIYNTPLENPEFEIFTLNDEESFVLWDGELSNLAAFQHAVPLAEKSRFLLKRTPTNTGLWRIFFGYRLAGGEIIFTAEPLTITVNESR
ncbi:MAG: hypothetical protein GY862_27355, partial [Gammaproteobacteria bacterium]|nr:hypothetical protein [Gammaproteobacteria bacterium]